MSNLMVRNSIFDNLFDFRRDFDQLFNRFLSGWPWAEGQGQSTSTGAFTPAVETYVDRNTKKFHCRVSLPGIDPSEVKLEVHGNTLTISGERRMSRKEEDVDYVHREVMYGSFERAVALPEGVETEKLNAEYVNGVLEISAPVASAALPRRIEIKGAGKAKQIAA